MKRQSRCNLWLRMSVYWLVWKWSLFWSCLFTLSLSVQCCLFSEDICQMYFLSGQVQLFWYSILKSLWGYMLADLVYVISSNALEEASSIAVETSLTEPWGGVFMGLKYQDYFWTVGLARWEYGSHSAEAKSKSQASFKEQWNKILGRD